MKILFLDFDGVLNSTQEVYYKKNRRKTSLYWRWRESFGRSFYKLKYKKVKTPHGPTYENRYKHDLFGIIDKILDFSRDHISDHAEFCPIACSNIQHILNENEDVRIVVSSTWRLAGLGRVRQILKRNGIDYTKVIGITPTHHEGPNGEKYFDDNWKIKEQYKDVKIGRGTQIQAWLNEWQDVLMMTHFAIIDDDSDMCHLMDHLVKTNGNEGFMWSKAMETIKIIDGKGVGGV